MTSLNQYLQDGANHQARAVLCYLQGFSVEESWNKEFSRYEAEPNVSRWENCREQGYVITMRAKNGKCVNIAFFEHRNSDEICAIKWTQSLINAPTIDTAEYGGAVYKDKWDVSKSVKPGQIDEMSQWISDELTAFWLLNVKEKPAKATH